MDSITKDRKFTDFYNLIINIGEKLFKEKTPKEIKNKNNQKLNFEIFEKEGKLKFKFNSPYTYKTILQNEHK